MQQRKDGRRIGGATTIPPFSSSSATASLPTPPSNQMPASSNGVALPPPTRPVHPPRVAPTPLQQPQSSSFHFYPTTSSVPPTAAAGSASSTHGGATALLQEAPTKRRDHGMTHGDAITGETHHAKGGARGASTTSTTTAPPMAGTDDDPTMSTFDTTDVLDDFLRGRTLTVARPKVSPQPAPLPTTAAAIPPLKLAYKSTRELMGTAVRVVVVGGGKGGTSTATPAHLDLATRTSTATTTTVVCLAPDGLPAHHAHHHHRGGDVDAAVPVPSPPPTDAPATAGGGRPAPTLLSGGVHVPLAATTTTADDGDAQRLRGDSLLAPREASGANVISTDPTNERMGIHGDPRIAISRGQSPSVGNVVDDGVLAARDSKSPPAVAPSDNAVAVADDGALPGRCSNLPSTSMPLLLQDAGTSVVAPSSALDPTTIAALRVDNSLGDGAPSPGIDDDSAVGVQVNVRQPSSSSSAGRSEPGSCNSPRPSSSSSGASNTSPPLFGEDASSRRRSCASFPSPDAAQNRGASPPPAPQPYLPIDQRKRSPTAHRELSSAPSGGCASTTAIGRTGVDMDTQRRIAAHRVKRKEAEALHHRQRDPVALIEQARSDRRRSQQGRMTEVDKMRRELYAWNAQLRAEAEDLQRKKHGAMDGV